jgi:cyanate permease
VALGALMLVVAFPAVAIFIREPDARARALTYSDGVVPGLTVGESLRTSSFWLLAIPVFLVVTTINGIVGHLVPLLTDRGLELRQATATLSVVGLSTIAGRLVSGYLLDKYFAPFVTAVLFLLPLVGVSLLALGAGGVSPVLAAMTLGFGLGAEIDVIGFMVSRYFGLRAYGEIYGCMFAIFTVGTGLGPVLMGLSFDATGSYTVTLTMFGVALICASVLVARLGRYTFPSMRRRR